ncbi:MAG: transposase [Betaproteobacteria bacterium]
MILPAITTACSAAGWKLTEPYAECPIRSKLHFHCVVIDGLFTPAATAGAVFHPATIDRPAITMVQAKVRRRLLANFVDRGLLAKEDAQAMAQWDHGGGCSVDGSVRIQAADRTGRERLLRYCARPPYDLERLHELSLDRLAALVPPPRVHRHRYYGAGTERAAASRRDRDGHYATRAGTDAESATRRSGAAARRPPGQHGFHSHAQPAPEYEFDQRITW